ncbi:PIN domain-containing protein [Polaromonas sp. LjRoot131]|uniref:PIN domain-containing protein n=1 Tax=Polaromonas sp. LjRoot131 TaxID=3342262 RepID=UPI003ECC3A8F
MPKNLPTAAQAWEELTFFSIDTNLIQAAGYNFAQGALHQLPNQLPKSIGLQLPEIVVSEIVKHRMDPVLKAHKQLQGAADELHRQTTIDVSQVRNSVDKLNAIEVATQQFTQQVHDYAALCRGAVLPTVGADAVRSLFADYFAQRPPFGLSEKKKSEFPDAMCLWQLEQYANDNDTIGIIASDDKGWKQYADESATLYCAGSIDELAALFVATNEHAESIKAKIAAAVQDGGSPLDTELANALRQHIANAEWDASEAYTGSSHRLEADVYEANLVEYNIDGEISVWSAKGEPTTWIAELTVRVKANISVSVEFFAWDSIDREELSLGSQEFPTETVVDVEVFLTCTDVHLETEPNDWDTEIEIADGSYSLEGFEAELDYGPPDDE